MNVTLADRPSALDVAGIGYLVVQVGDLDEAIEFYRRVLRLDLVGRDILPASGSHAVLAAGRQLVVLASNPDRVDLKETGVHQAYRVSMPARDAIAAALAGEGVEVKAYKEDRPAEERDNFYFFDPAGNRIQLVVSGNAKAPGIAGIDHVAMLVADMLRSEDFYLNELGLAEDHRVGWATADYVRARKWAAGEEDMAPGTRRLDKRYTVMVNKKVVPRCNMQLFMRAGDAVLGIYLANQHFQEPPEELAVGMPRVALAAKRAQLDKTARALQAKGRTFLGPVVHPASAPVEASLYFRDVGGNFLELCVPRARG
ncbi:MAG TPA: VOC family protein [Alphaproteobacteria bacterium]|jgi:catechol 2,3-dioxygenase-like lactoylglutathione lyase family enzyme|nr:VOC family protein [Alphaproteobacteria bacterium]